MKADICFSPRTGKWFYYDGMDLEGPYDSRKEAEKAYHSYVEWLNTSLENFHNFTGDSK